VADEPQLQKGSDTRDWVVYLHQLLASAGYWNGGETGEFGDELEAAVIAYQSAAGLTANGVVDANTWNMLTGSGSSSPEQGQSAGGGILFSWDEFPELAASYNMTDDNAVKQDLVAMGLDPDVVNADTATA
jgi:peptidoglycan hydrolase-like protein with peptidoglycan-binding domain